MTNQMDIGSHDYIQREQIVDSCRAIKRHASYVGVAVSEMTGMPADFEPNCMDELNEAIGVLERAKQRLLNKPKYAQAAE